MKLNLKTACVAAMVPLWIASAASAYNISGTVYCDANQNETIDVTDLPLENVEVVVTNDNGLMRGDLTNAIGEYLIEFLQPGINSADLTPATLPSDAVVIGDQVHVFVLDDVNLLDSKDWLISSAICLEETICGDGIVDEGEECDDGNNVGGDGCSAMCTDEGGQGCTPGYWRQPHHYDSWAAPYTPDTLFSSVFEDAFPGQMLSDVVVLRGGGLNALGRHVAAALLNSASDEVQYGASTDAIIGAFNAVYPGTKSEYNDLKNDLEAMNESGCPLN